MPFDSKLLTNLLDPPILFFVLGVFTALIKSNLEVPSQVGKFLSLYLLMALGFKGGVALNHSGLNSAMMFALLGAFLMSALVPLYSFGVLRFRRIPPYDAAAIAATYGSVSAVTFIAASSMLERAGCAVGGHMAVALVIMESPAIFMAVLFATFVRSRDPNRAADRVTLGMGKVFHEAFTDGAHLLLLGSLVIGAITGEAGKKTMSPFLGDIFKGILTFFLLEMGILVGRRFRELKTVGPFLVAFALVMPLVNATVATVLAKLFGLVLGDAVLLAVLAASASYIVVPAVVRFAIPEANPSLYFSMALGVTFPFNLTIGLPLYFKVLRWLWE